MALVTGITLPNNGDRIKVENYNDPITKILSQVNGNLDSANVKLGSLGWEAMAPFTNKIPASAMQDSGNLELFRKDSKISYIVDGGVWSSVTGLNGAMTGGSMYTHTGTKVTFAAVASRAFLASRDTYVYITGGALGYLDVANNADRPSLPTNSLWLAKVATSASAITSVTDLRKLNPIGSENIDYSSFAHGVLTFADPATGDVNPGGTKNLNYNKLSSSSKNVTLLPNGRMRLDVAGVYLVVANLFVIDAPTNSIQQILYSTDNGNFFTETGWTIRLAADTNTRTFPSKTITKYFPAGTILQHFVDSGNSRFGGAGAYGEQTSLSATRIA